MAPAVKPNIVFVLADNIGWGDFGCYGGDTPTPRMDELAAGGIRFTNYNVESQCTPTRSAIVTGRQSVRSGTYTVPLPGTGEQGMTPWEYTIAELLSDAGYATALYGKWHLGEVEGRLPTDQGFDEWWRWRNSTDEAGWSSYAAFHALASSASLSPPTASSPHRVVIFINVVGCGTRVPNGIRQNHCQEIESATSRHSAS